MIRLWLQRRSSVPLREQLSAQLLLGILSRRVAPGERLPSVRDLARRLEIHANTVSAAYRDLAARGWVTQKRGSGVFVSDVAAPPAEVTVEAFARSCREQGLALGFTDPDLEAAFAAAFRSGDVDPPGLLVVHEDAEFARILAAEIAAATGASVTASDFSAALPAMIGDAHVLTTPTMLLRLRELPRPARLEVIRLRTLEEFVAPGGVGNRTPLIGIVSRSRTLTSWAVKLLSTLGVIPDQVLVRDPSQRSWQRGLAACDIVSADLIATSELPATLPVRQLRLVAEDFLAELGALVTAKRV